MMNEGSYNFAEIWQFPVHGSGSMSESGGGLGLRGAQFGHNLSQFGTNREVSGDDPVRLEQKMAHGNGARKRRDVEDESAKVVSTSSGNGNGVVFVCLFTYLVVESAQFSVVILIMEFLITWSFSLGHHIICMSILSIEEC